MAVSTVQLNGVTLMTVNDTTATASDVAKTKYFYAANGVKTEGTASGGGGGDDSINQLIQRTISGNYYNSDITVVGNYAFYSCNSLENVDFPNVTSIGTNAFYQCSSLASISFPNVVSVSNYAFAQCTALSYVYLPKLESCSTGTFNYCSNLIEASLPKLQVVSNYTFAACYKLQTVSLPELQVAGSYTFSNCSELQTVSLPKLQVVGNYTFAGCGKLQTVSLPVLTNVVSSMFNNCQLLESISLPMATIIGDQAFSSCYSLSEVYAPLVTALGANAFTYCSALESVDFPLISVISTTAFLNAYGLKRISFGSSTSASYVELTAAVFSGCTLLSDLQGVYHPSAHYAFANTGILEVTSEHFYLSTIGLSCFLGCKSLLRVDYQPSLGGFWDINMYMFRSCWSLSFVRYLQLNGYVESWAFGNCSNLRTVILSNYAGKSGGSIYSSAFAYCYNLLSLYLLNPDYIFALNNNAFYSTPISTYTTSTGGVRGSIFVPESLYSTYIAATNWVNYSARFVSLTDAQIQNVLQYGTHEP